jgi:hypothetical protein
MSSPADLYRQRAADAKKRAARAQNPSVKRAFEEVASGWLVLAEQMDGLIGRGLLSARKVTAVSELPSFSRADRLIDSRPAH